MGWGKAPGSSKRRRGNSDGGGGYRGSTGPSKTDVLEPPPSSRGGGGVPLVVTAAAEVAATVMVADPERTQRLWANWKNVLARVKAAGGKGNRYPHAGMHALPAADSRVAAVIAG